MATMKLLSQFVYVSSDDQLYLKQKYPNMITISTTPNSHEVLLIEDVVSNEEDIISLIKSYRGELVIIDLPRIKKEETLYFISLLKKFYRFKKVFVWRILDMDQALLFELKNTFKLKFKIVFDPSNILKRNQSPLAFYRMYKSHIQIFVAHDITTSHRPQLIGYGDTEMLNIIKRMKRDHFDGDIWIDPDFLRIIQKSKIPLIETLIPSLFKEKQYLKEKLNMDIKKDITSCDVYDNQIHVLNVIFKLW
jgi:SepF-like predicted cell division protein (DUF552 family)